MSAINFDYDPVPTIRQFALSDARIRGLMGPFGSGKSSGCVAEAVRRGQMMPRSPDGVRHSRYAIVRNTYTELRDTTIKTVFQWLPPLHFGHYAERRHSYQIKAFAGVDIELLFLALDRPDDISALLSLELSGAWVNEAREIPWGIIEALDGRIGRWPPVRDVGPEAWFGLWMDTNPPDSDSRWYRFFEDKGWLQDFLKLQREGHFPSNMAPESYAALFKQPSGLGPDAENLVNLQPGYYPKLAVGKAKEWVTVYCRGDYGFVVEGKLVYPEYSDQVHCTKGANPIEGCTVIRSWDFGLTPACIFSQLQPSGQWVTFDEMTSDNMSIDQFSDEVLEHCARSFKGNVRFEDWGDPAGNQRVQTDSRTCFQIMQAKNIEIDGSIQEPTHRQEAVRKPLRTLVGGEPQFILHPRCRVLRKGFLGGYHRRRLAVTGERYAKDPEKNLYSHPHDALQYGMVQYFGPAMVGDGPVDDDWPNGASSAMEDRRSTSSTGY